MCGIVGYLNLNGETLTPKHDHLATMCDSIAHRGPDEEGMKLVGPCALGMTRLAIIDLATGQQPITNEDGTIWIVFNGEIYNYQELQERVLSLGHKLATRSDTETIVHLYEEYGVECLQFLEGMFAFAIYDTKKERLFIARDRLGEKPLHWGVFEGTLLFSSEIKGILSHPKARRDLDSAAMQKYLALEYVPNPSSMFKGINKLPPAHFMIVEKGQVKVDRYWLPSIASEEMSEDEAAAEVVRLLKRSVELRLISEVPLGVFLSGGIDSSCIAAFASQFSKDPIKTFSIGFDDPSFDESPHALSVAKHIGSDHEVVTFSPDLAFETLSELWEILDEPLADASIVPTFFLSKMTRRHVTVALAGEGGDELFGGYPTYYAHKFVPMWTTVPRALRSAMIEPALNGLPVSLNNLSTDFKIKRFISAANEPPVRRHLRWMGSIKLSEHEQLLTKEHRALAAETMEESLFDSLPLVDRDSGYGSNGGGGYGSNGGGGNARAGGNGSHGNGRNGGNGGSGHSGTKYASVATASGSYAAGSGSGFSGGAGSVSAPGVIIGNRRSAGTANFGRASINDVVNNIMRLDMTTYLPDDLLVKSDRASMAASLEVRLPFLAYPLVEFALKMPPHMKVRGMTTKYLLKKAVAPYLPDHIMKRPKKGFGIPVGKWVRQEFRPVVDELLSESFIKRQGIFNWVYINTLLSEHMSQRVDRRKELWTILMFQWWWRKFFDS